MITKYVSALDVKLEICSDIHDHNSKLLQDMEDDKISYDEYKRLAYPPKCLQMLDVAIERAFDKSKFSAALTLIKDKENADW